VYIFIGLFDITLPFYNWIGDSALSFSIRKESGTTKLNAIPYFCFVFFFFEGRKMVDVMKMTRESYFMG
jgi:hypothetical protein